MLLTIGLTVLALLSLLRVEHLIASDLWIRRNGERWQADLRALTPSQRSDPLEMWRCYQARGGGKLPYLYFGIRSHRLLAWHRSATNRGARTCLFALRFVWRYFFFAPAVSIIVILVSLLASGLPMLARWDLLVLAISTAIGLVTIAAEGVLASLLLESWAVEYHRFKKRSKNDYRIHEVAVIWGCVGFVALAAVGLASVCAAQFHAYSDFPQAYSEAGKFWAALQIAIPGMFSASWQGATTAVGMIGNLTLLALYVGYFLLLIATGLPVVLSRSPDDAPPASDA
ncbi:MAG TPA: hypothetical protein VGF95_02260 [Solirubrobacteraceae bacterium]|jgi:hypothetical protein